MKKIMIVLLVAFSATMFVNNSMAAVKVNPKGIWAFNVPSAPVDYSKGELIFGETDGQPTVIVKLGDGTELKVQNLKLEADSFSFEVQIEYNQVKVSGKIANDKMTGKVDSAEGIMELTAVKKS